MMIVGWINVNVMIKTAILSQFRGSTEAIMASGDIMTTAADTVQWLIMQV